MNSLTIPTGLCIAGYFCGSIPFGLLLGKLFARTDVRKTGSGNIGATNVARSVGLGAGISTLILDAAKGAFPVWVARHYFPDHAAYQILAGLAALAGHCFPVWLKFRGGKGVATYIGILLGLFWPAALLFCVVWLLIAVITRYSSLSALIASLAAPIFLWSLGHAALAALFALLTLLVFYAHRTNISRLLAGTEGKIGQKA